MIRGPADFSLKPRRKNAKRGNLFRRQSGGPIYCRFFVRAHGGPQREIRRCTDCTDERLARIRAWEIYAYESGLTPAGATPPRRLRIDSPRIGAIVEHYRANTRECSARGVQPAVVAKYISVLSRAIRLVTGAKGESWRNINISVLDDKFIHTWRARRYKDRGLDIDNPTQFDLAFNSNLNHELQNMRALFCKAALHAYRDAGMQIPNTLERFLTLKRLESQPRGFTAIDTATDQQMKDLAAASISGLDQPGLPEPVIAVIYELARYCALTRKEIVWMQKDWVSPGMDRINIAPYQDYAGQQFQTKSNSKNGTVPVDPDRVRRWLTALEPYFTATAPGYMLPGKSRDAREKLIDLKTNPWIARFLPERNKRLHELRKQAGSDVFHLHGLSAAAAFIRDSEITARAYYLPSGHDSAAMGVSGL